MPLLLYPPVPIVQENGWDPTVGMDAVEKRKTLHCWESNPSCPAHSPLLYWLSYPDSKKRRSTLLTYKEEIFQIFVHVLVYSSYTEGQVA
jgi:hypothetical protein